MKVPQMAPWLGIEEYRAIAPCFEDNWVTEGPKTKEFHEKLLKLMGARFGVFAPNGTLALYLGLRALDIGSGDEVIVSDFTFFASATSVEMTGAKPVFVDVNKKNFQIDLENADKLVNSNTKAIMPVHIYGTVANMGEVVKFAKKHNLKIIEDACQALAVHRDGKHSGTFGEIGCFSFFADKTITTVEGGFVITNDEKLYKKLLYLRNQGRIDRGSFIHPEIGYNFRITDIHSAIGLAQLKKLPEIKKRKSEILNLYKKLLKDVEGITFFEPDEGVEMIPFRICILVDKAHELMAYMKDREIEPRTFFYPLHKQPSLKYLHKLRSDQGDDFFPNSIYGYEHGICLPVFPTLTEEQIIYICDVIKEFMNKPSIFYGYYDILFKSKDYSKETEIVFKLAKKYGKAPTTVLEIGAGTGNHTIEIAKKATTVLAIDTDPNMVHLAKEKIDNLNIKNVTVTEKSIEQLDSQSFDLSLALFNVVTYISEIDQLVSFMKGVSTHLAPDGIFIFDCWNGVAAIKDPPKSKNITVHQNGKLIESNLTSKTDLFNQKTTLNYNIRVTNGKFTEEDDFSFDQILWTPMQIIQALKEAGLEMIFCSPLMEPESKATDKDWKIMFVARKPKN